MDNFQLHQLQNIETDILSQIDSFCTKFDLKYSLYAGTAIGAVRHHGFIPWDDDVDICMKRRDFEKFQDIWKNNSIPGLFMQGTHIEDQSHYTHIKIFKDGTLYCTAEEYKEPIHHGVWIDIFALDNVPKNKLKRIVQKIWAIIRMALTKDKVIHNRGIAIKLFSAFFVSLPKNLKLKLRRKSDIEVTKYADCSDGYALKSFNSILGIKSKEGFPFHCMDEFIKVKYDEYSFMLSADYHEMLFRSYGDYMKLPPEKDRHPTHPADFIQLE